MRIAISGRSGCGNTTVSKLLGTIMGFPVINFTFRQMAEERRIDFWDYCALAERDFNIDRELDRRQVEMAMKEKNAILASRLAIWMLKSADLKVYIDVSANVRAERIQRREGGTLEKRLEETLSRDEKDHNRYLAIYGIDNYEFKNVADLVVNGDNLNPEEIAKLIQRKALELGTC